MRGHDDTEVKKEGGRGGGAESGIQLIRTGNGNSVKGYLAAVPPLTTLALESDGA